MWSTPLIIDPVTGRKFGKSEGNAIWLESSDNGGGNYTSIFDFYQFWLGQPDEAVAYLLKIYTLYEKEGIDTLLIDFKVLGTFLYSAMFIVLFCKKCFICHINKLILNGRTACIDN